MEDLTWNYKSVRERVQREIALLEEQIRKSRRARNADPYAPLAGEHEGGSALLPRSAGANATLPSSPRRETPTRAPPAASESGSPLQPRDALDSAVPPAAADSPAPAPPRVHRSANGKVTAAADPRALAASSASPSASHPRDLSGSVMEGYLLHLTKTTFSEKFVKQYIVVSEARGGIEWYSSKEDFSQDQLNPAKRGRRELGFVPFFTETKNSRGSRFKKAAVCWPLILPEDCSRANDPSMTYFAIEHYVTTQGSMDGRYEKIILATEDPQVRNDWIFFLTKYIGLFLPPCDESLPLTKLPRGAETPMHVSMVLDGEAPGGNVR